MPHLIALPRSHTETRFATRDSRLASIRHVLLLHTQHTHSHACEVRIETWSRVCVWVCVSFVAAAADVVVVSLSFVVCCNANATSSRQYLNRWLPAWFYKVILYLHMYMCTYAPIYQPLTWPTMLRPQTRTDSTATTLRYCLYMHVCLHSLATALCRMRFLVQNNHSHCWLSNTLHMQFAIVVLASDDEPQTCALADRVTKAHTDWAFHFIALVSSYCLLSLSLGRACVLRCMHARTGLHVHVDNKPSRASSFVDNDDVVVDATQPGQPPLIAWLKSRMRCAMTREGAQTQLSPQHIRMHAIM